MKKLRKISLHQLDGAELEKRQEGLLFGGGTPGECRCGSCSATTNAADNRDANHKSGYTHSGSNPDAECRCPSSTAQSAMSTPPAF